jgi:predicted ATPase
MINKIGVENFRVFKDYTEFELRPLTLLTGPNNAGKSSLTKLLLLLKNGIEELNFKKGLHNLEEFNKVLNIDIAKESKRMKIGFNFDIGFFNDLKMFLSYEDGKIMEILFQNNGEELIRVFINHVIPDNEEGYTLAETFFEEKITFNIESLIDLIYEKDLICEIHDEKCKRIKKPKKLLFDDFGNTIGGLENLIEQVPLKLTKLSNLQIPNNEIKEVNFESLKDHLWNKHFASDEDYPTDLNKIVYAWYNEIDNLEKDYLLYNFLLNGENITYQYKEEILKQQKLYFNKLRIHFDNGHSSDGFTTYGSEFLDDPRLYTDLKMLQESLLKSNEDIKNLFISFFKDKFGLNNIEVIESKLGNIIFKQNIFKNLDDKNEYGTIMNHICGFIIELKHFLKSTEYISPMRGNQKRVLFNRSESEIDEIVANVDINYQQEYIEKVVKIISKKIGKVRIQREQSTISIVWLKLDNEEEMNLADFGFGYSQLIPIILKIIDCVNNQNYNLIIEEPEANLHPNLQSMLADIFVLTLKYFENFNFIIETHSEYFIRKLQYLTALNESSNNEDLEKSISPDKSIIYYFNDKEFVNAQEPKVKKIEINNRGSLSDTFGQGFYDETARLQFDFISLRREQSN